MSAPPGSRGSARSRAQTLAAQKDRDSGSEPAVISRLRESLAALKPCGHHSIRSLRRALVLLEGNHRGGKVTRSEIRWALRGLGVEYSQLECGNLVTELDRQNTGYVKINDLMSMLRGRGLDDDETALVETAWRKIYRPGGPKSHEPITLSALEDAYDGDWYPLVDSCRGAIH